MFHAFLSSADFFFKIRIPSECEAVWISFVGPDLGPIYSQKLSADDTKIVGKELNTEVAFRPNIKICVFQVT